MNARPSSPWSVSPIPGLGSPAGRAALAAILTIGLALTPSRAESGILATSRFDLGPDTGERQTLTFTPAHRGRLVVTLSSSRTPVVLCVTVGVQGERPLYDVTTRSDIALAVDVSALSPNRRGWYATVSSPDARPASGVLSVEQAPTPDAGTTTQPSAAAPWHKNAFVAASAVGSGASVSGQRPVDPSLAKDKSVKVTGVHAVEGDPNKAALSGAANQGNCAERTVGAGGEVTVTRPDGTSSTGRAVPIPVPGGKGDSIAPLVRADGMTDQAFTAWLQTAADVLLDVIAHADAKGPTARQLIVDHENSQGMSPLRRLDFRAKVLNQMFPAP